jgi:hypothetical protein
MEVLFVAFLHSTPQRPFLLSDTYCYHLQGFILVNSLELVASYQYCDSLQHIYHRDIATYAHPMSHTKWHQVIELLFRITVCEPAVRIERVMVISPDCGVVVERIVRYGDIGLSEHHVSTTMG